MTSSSMVRISENRVKRLCGLFGRRYLLVMTNNCLGKKMGVEEYLATLMDKFRERLMELSDEERSATSRGLCDFTTPCQSLVIWARDPEFQIVLFSHLQSFEDKLVKVYGPIENNKLVSEIEKKILNDNLVKAIGREHVENALIYVLRSIRNHFAPLSTWPKRGSISLKHRISNSAFLWVVVGNIVNVDMNEVLSRCIQDIKSISKPKQPARIQERVLLKGYGTYIYPPVWIGEIPKPSFSERLRGPFLWRYSNERVITTTFKDAPLIVTRDGYIAIGVEDKRKALTYLNEIMATLLVIRRIPVFIIRELDLGETEITEHGFTKSWYPLSIRSKLYSPLEERYSPEVLAKERRIIKEEDVAKIIRWSELITTDERLKTLLLLTLETFTHVFNSEYKQALILGWVVLEEFYINELWKEHVLNKVDKNRKGKLRRWTADSKIEALSIAGIMPSNVYENLRKLKNERNNVVHRGREPSSVSVKLCLELIHKVVKSYISRYLAEHMHEL